MVRYLLVPVLLSIGMSLFAQNQEVRKSELNKLFRKSISQDSKRVIQTVSNPWISDNTDGLFFKADTIRLINVKKQYIKTFCETINWSFYDADRFYQIESQTCNEPSSTKVSDENNDRRMTVEKTDKGVVLITYNLSGLIERFLVLSIYKSEIKDEILLIRMESDEADKL